MKKTLQLIVSIAVAALLPITATAQGGCSDYTTIPYTTGFEGIATDGLPDCWQQITTGTNSGHTFPSVYQWPSNTRNGSCYFEFEASSSSSDTELVALPLMQNISGLKLTMWVSASSSYPCSLEVGVMEDSLFVPVDTLNLITFSGASNWNQNYHEYTVYFAGYTGYGERMAIRAVRSGYGQYTLFIDDLTVSEDNGCYPLSNLTMTYADSESVSLAWVDEMNVGASYTVTYWKDGGDTVVVYSLTDTFYTATGLDASTAYHFVVTPNCSGGDGIPVSATFRTTCGILMVPFTEGFEDAGALDCWSMISCATYTGCSTASSHSGTASFRFYYNLTPPQYLVTPPLGGTDNDGITVSFWYKKYSASYTENFTVGYSYTTTDDTAFVWGSEVNPTTSWQEFTATYPAGVRYVAVKYLQNNGYYLYIDDFHVGIDNGCNKPSDAMVDSVAPYDAYLRWTNGGSSASSYTVYYGTTDNVASATAVSGIIDTVYNLSSLLPQTTYYAWVMTECGSDSSDTKAFPSFTTQMTCASLTDVVMGDVSYTAAVVNWGYNTGVGFPSSEVVITLVDITDTTAAPITVTATGTSYTFTGLDAGHGYTATLRNVCDVSPQYDTATSNTVTFMTASCAEISGTTTFNYLPTYTYYNYSFGEMIYTASQMPNVDTIRGIAFNVVTPRSTTRTVDVYLGHTAYSSFSGNTAWISSDSLTLVASTASLPASSEGWVVIPFDSAFVYDGVSNLVVAIDDNTGSWVSAPSWKALTATSQGIYAYSDYTSYDPSNVGTSGTVANSIPAVRFVAECDVPSCFAPMLTLDNVDSSSISIHWSAVGIEDTWVVGIKASGDANYTFMGNVTDTFYTFSSLDANTLYSVYVASLCTDTLPTVITVRTACGPVALPFFEDWESIPSNGAWPTCWDSTMHHGTDPSVNWEYNHTSGGQYSMFLMASNDYNLVVSPAIPLPGDQITVNFFGRLGTSATSWLKAGVITNPHDTSTFVPLLTVPDHDGQFHEYEFTTAGLDATATYHVAWLFYATSTASSSRGAIDDISIMQSSPCPRPSYATIDSVQGSEVWLHWSATSAGNYEVGYTTVNDVNDSSLQTVTVGDTATSINGLDPMTLYYFWVRALCGSDVSYWREVGSIATQCDTTTCDVTIQMVDSYGDGWNGGAVNVYQAGMLMGSATITGGSTGTANISVCSSSPVEFRLTRGSWPAEMGCTILDGGGAQLFTSSDMSTFSENSVIATSAVPCPSCITPGSLTVAGITTDAATATWDAGTSGLWEVYLDSVLVDSVTAPTYTFNSLTANTTYTVAVRAICAVGDTSAFAQTTFHTVCAYTSLPYSEDFNAVTGTTYSSAGDLPGCWDAYSNGTSAVYFPHVVGSGAYHYSPDGSNSLCMTSGGSSYGSVKVVVLPAFNAPVNALTMDFWYQTESSVGSLSVGYVTGFNYDSDFVSVAEMPDSYNGSVDTVDFSSVPATATNIAFRWTYTSSYYSVCIDNVNVNVTGAAPCAAPAVGNVVEDVESLTVHFSATSPVELAIVQGNATNPPASTDTVVASSHLFTNLQPSTLYTIFLRQLCSDSTASVWTSVTATTLDLGCVPPTGLTVQGTAYTSAILGWTQVGDEVAWQVNVFNTTFDSVYTVTTNPVVISGLIPAVTYHARIRSLCGIGNDLPGEWGDDTVTFTTDICPDAEGLSITNVTAHTADASWNATTGVSGYRLLWFMEDDEVGSADVANPFYQLTGLEAEMPYRVLLKNICTEGALSEHWVSAEFTTPAGGGEGIDDVTGAAFTLYPNPASGSVTVSLDATHAIVEVLDISGRTLLRSVADGQRLTLDISSLSAGAYFVRVTGADATAVQRLVVR